MSWTYDTILEKFAETFASKDDTGHWWGHDTDLGDCGTAFRTAKQRLGQVKREQLPSKFKGTIPAVVRSRRQAISKAVWGTSEPAWWKGSTGEYELMEHIAQFLPKEAPHE